MFGRAESEGSYVSELDRLTPRERLVATLAAQGMSNPEIARQLCKSPATINSQLDRVYRKLKVKSRSELTALMQAQILLDQAQGLVAELPEEIRAQLSLLSIQDTTPAAILQIARNATMQPREVLTALDALWRLRTEELRKNPQLQTNRLFQSQ